MILLVVIALAVRLDAAPPPDGDALAVRYAKLLTGADRGDDSHDSGGADESDEAEESGDAGEAEESGEAGEAGELAELDRSQEPEAAHEPADLGQPDRGVRVAITGDDRDELAWGDDHDDELAMGSDGDELAWSDAGEVTPEATTGATIGAAPDVAISAAEIYDAWMRHPRPSAWGRFDVGLAWQRRASEPRFAPPRRIDEVWLVATWRR